MICFCTFVCFRVIYRNEIHKRWHRLILCRPWSLQGTLNLHCSFLIHPLAPVPFFLVTHFMSNQPIVWNMLLPPVSPWTGYMRTEDKWIVCRLMEVGGQWTYPGLWEWEPCSSLSSHRYCCMDFLQLPRLGPCGSRSSWPPLASAFWWHWKIHR